MKGKFSVWAVLAVIVAIAAFIGFIAYANSLDRPKFGAQMMDWASDLETSRGDFKFIGDMDKQVYYPKDDPRVQRIPKNKRVYFVDEKAAKAHYFKRG